MSVVCGLSCFCIIQCCVKSEGVERSGEGLKVGGCGHLIPLRGSTTRARQGTRPQDSLKTGELRGLQSCSTPCRAVKPLLVCCSDALSQSRLHFISLLLSTDSFMKSLAFSESHYVHVLVCVTNGLVVVICRALPKVQTSCKRFFILKASTEVFAKVINVNAHQQAVSCMFLIYCTTLV